jgi:hypothetical protein
MSRLIEEARIERAARVIYEDGDFTEKLAIARDLAHRVLAAADDTPSESRTYCHAHGSLVIDDWCTGRLLAVMRNLRNGAQPRVEPCRLVECQVTFSEKDQHEQ